MSGTYFINYETSGGWKAFINPECISHIYPKCGLTIVVMINGYEYTFDGPMEDFMNRIRKDIAEANRDII